ncbi:hypothetical protein ACFSJS_12245 [Streptomyces desertarenae]|uniref:ABC transporter permease n=1 Tax=Streptomyces desertarenae TaxID=2666184 RepID=A0ABW4PME1_9ACTN
MTHTTTTHRDRRMLALMNEDRHRGLHATRARRRGLVAAHVALTAALLAALWALSGHDLPPYAAIPAALVALVAWCAVTGVLNLSTRGLLELRTRALDERQLTDRGRALTTAHRTSLALQAAALLGLHLAHEYGGARLTAPLLLGVLFALLVAHWLLPLWIAALTAPDEPADDA